MPLVTVVVAALNCADTIARCIDSVVSQDLHPELIVIDGGSSDETLQFLNCMRHQIDHFVSEPDRGIYDAWNKALGIAKGQWVCFLGADDHFADTTSLRKLCLRADSGAFNFISGRAAWINRNDEVVRIVGEPWNWARMKRYQVIAHVGALHHRTLFQQYGKFDERFRIAGDYDFLLRAGPGIRADFVNEIVVCTGIYGKSLTSVSRALSEARQIQMLHPEIGRGKANVNFLLAHAKRGIRQVASWFR